MSISIEFHQIKKQKILSENKIFGLCEVLLSTIEWGKACHYNIEIFKSLLDDANTWGETYLQPTLDKFIFYLFAVDTESDIGIRTENGLDIISAIYPKHIIEFINHAKLYTQYGKSGGFDKLFDILEDAIAKDMLIVTKIC